VISEAPPAQTDDPGKPAVAFVQFMAKFEVFPGVYVDELSGKPVLAALSKPTECPKMWLDGSELVLSTGDRFPMTSVFRYRLA
jgi:hypothetical protein